MRDIFIVLCGVHPTPSTLHTENGEVRQIEFEEFDFRHPQHPDRTRLACIKLVQLIANSDLAQSIRNGSAKVWFVVPADTYSFAYLTVLYYAEFSVFPALWWPRVRGKSPADLDWLMGGKIDFEQLYLDFRSAQS